MNPKQAVISLTLTALALPAAIASSPPPSFIAISKDDKPIRLRRQPASHSTATLRYKNYRGSYYDIVDADGDRMSLRSLLDPPAVKLRKNPTFNATSGRKRSTERTSPITQLYSIQDYHRHSDRMSLRSLLDPPAAKLGKTPASAATSSRERSTTKRTSPITQLHSIQDYHRHVLHEPNQLCIIRFSAPWCQACRKTNVAWDRMASRIHKMNVLPNTKTSKQIKFLSVFLDDRDEATVALKDMLQIKRVPQGIIHHPTQGVFGQKVDLNRSNLSLLKKRLERYSEEDRMESGMVIDGLNQ